MRFQVLSHAGLAVEHAGLQLVCDPWLAGSAYWRAWWNYPPVTPAVLESVRPDFIYLTHIHWDHFHGVTLRRFSRKTPILVPRGPNDRLVRDLQWLGFTDVRELDHGRPVDIAPGFRVTSHHFGPFLDSAVVIEAGGVTLLNSNDAKVMGRPLRNLLRQHAPIDFVLRSHSSANARLCFEIVDDPTVQVDDGSRYVRDFTDFVRATGARWAVPFASNHCYLHREVERFNASVTTPLEVARHFSAAGIQSPQLQVMVSGDSWSSEDGFSIATHDWFTHREAHLAAYRAAVAPALEKEYAADAAAGVDVRIVRAYFEKLCAAVPWPLRRRLKGAPVTFVLRSGTSTTILDVDLGTGSVDPRLAVDDASCPAQVHVAARVFMQCIERDLFSHLSISKRVRYRVTRTSLGRVQRMNLLFNLYEYELLPLRNCLRGRFLRACWQRRAEFSLYAAVVIDRLRGRGFDARRYLPGALPLR